MCKDFLKIPFSFLPVSSVPHGSSRVSSPSLYLSNQHHNYPPPPKEQTAAEPCGKGGEKRES